jgi:pilus assembly protein CpaB
VLRKPGEQNNPVVETISMNDLRYNIYGGARYPAPAAVGGFGSGIAAYRSAVSGALEARAGQVAASAAPQRATARSTAKAAPAKKPGKSVEIYRGTTSNEYKVGG